VHSLLCKFQHDVFEYIHTGAYIHTYALPELFSRLEFSLYAEHMKRSLQEPLLPAPTRPRLTDDVSSEHHHQQQIAEHYSNRLNQTVEERELSPIIHLKKLNNWIKSVLVQTYTKKGDSVIDIACGKGGDLIKWDKARIGYYLGLDIAEGSIEDARMRYNGEDGEGGGGGGNMKKRKKTGTFSFPARLICADCFAVSLEEILEEEEAPFDVCSCQFALHYSWVSEQRARLALRNAASVLKPGGFFIGTLPDANVLVRKLRDSPGLEFGNSCYSVRFVEYIGLCTYTHTHTSHICIVYVPQVW
jgi:SAM-dependent methyltransferase